MKIPLIIKKKTASTQRHHHMNLLVLDTDYIKYFYSAGI